MVSDLSGRKRYPQFEQLGPGQQVTRDFKKKTFNLKVEEGVKKMLVDQDNQTWIVKIHTYTCTCRCHESVFLAVRP